MIEAARQNLNRIAAVVKKLRRATSRARIYGTREGCCSWRAITHDGVPRKSRPDHGSHSINFLEVYSSGSAGRVDCFIINNVEWSLEATKENDAV
jgi:hypothetical protein